MGIKKCCDMPSPVWGVSCNVTNLLSVLFQEQGGAFLFGDETLKDLVLPPVGSPLPLIGTEQTWTCSAAKVPAWYPYGCETKPPISTSSSEGDGTWESFLCTVGESIRIHTEEDGFDTESKHSVYQNLQEVASSRAIYINGEQKYVVYGVTGHLPTDPSAGFTAGGIMKDHVRFNITTQESEYFAARYRGTSAFDTDHQTYMHTAWAYTFNSWFPFNVGELSSPYPGMYEASFSGFSTCYLPAQSSYYGMEYFVFSGFIPDPTIRLGHAHYWRVGRLKYEDLTQINNNGTEGSIGLASNHGAYGAYLIQLPSNRAYLTVSDAVDQPDEPWVSAVSNNENRDKLVDGRWLSSNLRTEDGDPTETEDQHSFADGTINEEEVVNVIVDGSSPPEAFPDEEFKNIQMRCYQHVFGTSIGIFTTDPDDSPPTETPIADFEPEANKKRYLYNTQVNDGAGDTVYDFVDAIPPDSATTLSFDTTATDYISVGRFTWTVTETLYGFEQIIPIKVNIDSLNGTGTVSARFRLVQQNNVGGDLAFSDYSDEFDGSGQKEFTLALTPASDSWITSQRFQLELELKLTDGTDPAGINIEVSSDNSYIELAITDSGSLNHNLPPEITFTSSGEPPNDWSPDNAVIFKHPPDYSPGDYDTNKWVCKCHSSPSFLTTTSLELDIQVVNNSSDLKFKYVLDNEGRGADFPYIPTGFPASTAEGTDVLRFFIDGKMIREFDNSLATSAADFRELKQYQLSVDDNDHLMSPGPHRLRWDFVRRTDDSNREISTFAAIDDVELPEIMTSVDINGVKRWFFVKKPGEDVVLQKASLYAWPKRDQESETVLTGRVSTVPDYIAYDWRRDRIYYGNPHYITCWKWNSDSVQWEPDEGFCDTGIFAFTASPLIPAPDMYQDADCQWITILNGVSQDLVADPPWGRFQILPFENGIQIRGANAHIRDATAMPIPLSKYETNQWEKDAFFIWANANLGGWASRLHAWTFSFDGKDRLPHMQVLWSPLYHQPAYPVPPPYDNPINPDNDLPFPGPWPDWMLADSPDIPDGQQLWARVRDPRHINEETEALKPVWVYKHRISSRIYCDAIDRLPQFIWTHNPNDDPTAPDEMLGLWPDTPWPSAQYMITPSYHIPISTNFAARLQPSEVHCPVLVEDPEGSGIFVEKFHYNWDINGGLFNESYDFDVVDNGDFCSCGSDKEILRKYQSA